MRPIVEDLLASRIKPGWKVLDTGGGRDPSRHATHVLDIFTRQEVDHHWGPIATTLPADNWIVWDLCDPRPFPFPDKYFDYVICSHTLEDIRDPVRVCQELSRVAKAGYVECPSPMAELVRGVDPGGRSWVGYYHHRWIVAVENGGLGFLFKPHFLASSRRFHLPPRARGWWAPNAPERYSAVFWEGRIDAREIVMPVREDLEAAIERIVTQAHGRTTLPIAMARVRAVVWRHAVAVLDGLGIRQTLRPLAARIRRWV